ncbi:hypothetical protein [Undibacterium sp. Ren11W]|uniref:hypothetical protein n=1 Tax=Undibacterium sp. Ren11W TaxID=3413045 RepID=UPI003BF588B3
MSEVTIVRPWAYFGFARALKVSIDGVNIGSISSRKTEKFSVSSGSHTIQVSMDWCKSVPLSINVSENSTVSLKVEAQFILLAALCCFFRPSKVFKLVGN